MVAMPPWPSSSTSRYLPPSVLPMSAKISGPRSWFAGGPDDDRARLAVTLGPLQGQPLEIRSELGRQIRTLQCQFDGCLEPAHGRACVVAGALERVGEDWLFL